MVPNNKLRFIRRVLYSLKRDYGTPMDLYQLISSETNPKTGKVTLDRRRISIRKAIILPSVLARKFSYDLSYIAANKNFTYGANYDINSRTVIVEANDLPSDIEIKIDDWVVIENRRYEIKSSERLEHGYGFLLSLKETLGALPLQSLLLSVNNKLHIEQRVATWA